MKGKETLSEKLVGANISQWKDHKMISAAFFLNLQKFFQNPSELEKTYGEYSHHPSYMDKNLENYTEDNNSYQKTEKMEKDKLNDFGTLIQEQYLKVGISTQEAELRREKYGPNKMPERKKRHWIFDLIHEMTTLFAFLMWGGGILAVIAYGLNTYDQSNLWLAVVLWITMIITGLFAFYQNQKSEGILESFKSIQTTKATVIRSGKMLEINTYELVVGDVVIFKIGEKIPADVRVFETNSLQVDNSGLTGESEPVKITGICGEKGYATPLEAKNIAFFTCLCVSGYGKGVVIRTGKESYMGKISDLSQEEEHLGLPIERELNYFIKIIFTIAVTLGGGFFLGALGQGMDTVAAFAFAIGIIVGNVPEGLLTCLTVALTITAQKLYTKNIMIKNIGAIETLGSVTCICSDKTGTLTQNRMTVVNVWYNCEIHKTKESQPDFEIDRKIYQLKVFNPEDPSFKIFKFASVCGSASNFKKETPDDYPALVKARNEWNNSNKLASGSQKAEKLLELKKQLQPEYDEYYKKNVDERLTDGDASESGIIKFFEKIQPIDQVRKLYPQHRVNGEDIKIPFNSKIKCAGFLRKVENPEDTTDSNFLLAFKGAPDFLIKKCTHYLLNGKEYEIDSFFKQKFSEANNAFALKGQRVLAMAYYRFEKKSYPVDFIFKNDVTDGMNEENKIPNYPTDKLCIVGLVALEDPPREGVKEAIAQCKTSGIKVIMVTGDQTLTAASIAYQIGIIENLDDTPEVIMEKERLNSLEEAEAKSNVSKTIIFICY
jgi:sodium/potassium-transporting ATPase subunit alpha